MIIDKATEAAAREMVAWMKAGGVNVHAPVENINLAQMKALATIARDAYTTAVSKLLVEYKDQIAAEDKQQIEMWLA